MDVLLLRNRAVQLARRENRCSRHGENSVPRVSSSVRREHLRESPPNAGTRTEGSNPFRKMNKEKDLMAGEDDSNSRHPLISNHLKLCG